MLNRKHSNNIRAIALEKKSEMKEESLKVFCLWIFNIAKFNRIIIPSI